MCGLAGILQLEPGARVSEHRLQSMLAALVHRGPDDVGVWLDGPVGLGHRRLAIVDLSTGHQPMATADGRLCVILNGEIYNHLQLRAELEARGHRYQTHSDTEALLHVYDEFGDAGVERLRGMYAYALWDRARTRLTLVRDRLGIKPLYYAVAAHELLFASEIKAILAAGFPADINDAVLPEFLANRFVAGETTFFRGIFKLRPGHSLTWTREQGLRHRRYWRLPITADHSAASLHSAARHVEQSLRESVAAHLMSDVPLGVFLSGGMDSSALAAITAAITKEPINTFSVGFTEAGANELGFARLMAKRIHSHHQEVVVTAAQFFAAMPRLIWHEDEPIAFTSSVPLYFVSRLAQRHVKVVLTGEGADEVFLGYNRYRIGYWNERLERYLNWLPRPARAHLRTLLTILPHSLRRQALRSCLARPAQTRALIYDNFAVCSEATQRQLLADPQRITQHDPYEECMRLYEEASGDARTRMSATDLQTYLVELLMKQDQMSMAASVESRVPYLDHLFVEAMAQISVDHKLRGLATKVVLREALRGLLPTEILQRRKMGFPVPIGQWLRGPYGRLLDTILLSPRARARAHFRPQAVATLANEHRAGVADHAEALWLLMGFELWQRIFIDGEDVDDVTETCTFSG